jgi:tetratricopeptide (TPR) repeat protein
LPKWCIALAVLALGLRALPADTGCAFTHALDLHRSGDLEGALREYRACLGVEPERMEARANLGAVLSTLGRYQEAIEQYQQALKSASPEVAFRLRFNLGLAYYKSFQIPQATAEFEALNALSSGDANTALLLADCYLRTGQSKKAIDLLTPLEPAQAGNSALDYALGMALIREGRVAEGRERVDRILGQGESAEGHFLLGSAMFTGHDYPGAAREFAKAVSLNPKLPSLQSFYGQALLATGDAGGAAEAFRKELASYPNDYDANFQLASILAHRGKPEEARPLLERAAQVRPGSVEARNALLHGFRFDDAVQPSGGIEVGAPAPGIGGLDMSRLAKPVVLVFGSYTCPRFRGGADALNRLFDQYSDKVDFRLIYIREAHAGGEAEALWQSTINEREGIALKPARDLMEKHEHANECIRKLHIQFPVLVDNMEGRAETVYDAWPSRVYLIGRNGRVAYTSRLGELDFHSDRLAAAIRETLAKGAAYGGSR